MAKHLRIAGVVQGVGFRYSMQREADRLGITGWVRNRGDGTVEAVIDGSAKALEDMLAWVTHGPPSAKVSNVSITEVLDSFEDFQLRKNA